MFYELESLESQLKCPICLERYISPRILPCGKSICLSCIDQLSKSDEHEHKSLECPICLKTHLVPNDGFILNEFILNTLQLKPKKVYRCPSFEKFDHLLSKIKVELVEIEEKLDRPSEKIAEYCDRLRNQVDIRTEMLIEKLNTFRCELIDEIKSFEQKSLKNLSITSDMAHKFKSRLKEVTKRLTDHQKYINQAKIEESTVKRMLSEAKINEFNLRNYSTLIDSKLFGPSVIRFDESRDGLDHGPDLLGKLNYEELKYDNKMIDLDKLSNMKAEINIDCKMPVDRVAELGNKLIVSSENTIKIIENESESAVEIRFDQNPECLLTNNKDLIFVQHTRNIWKNNRKERNSFSSLSVYDLSLNLKSEISPDFVIASCCCTDFNIFVQTDRTMVVNVFNWSLEKITSFGQIHFFEKPYFFKDAILKLVQEDRMYFKKQTLNEHEKEEQGFIRVISLTNGELVSQYSLSLRDEYFNIDNLGRTIVVDVNTCWLRIYDRPRERNDQVELIYEREIDWLKDVSRVRLTDDGRLCFVNNKQLINYVSVYS